MSREARREWCWWERWLHRAYLFFVGPFVRNDGTGAMTRWAVCFFTYAEVHRLLKITTPLGPWEALTVFFILFALPIDGALSKAKPSEVLGLIGKPFARAGDAIDQGASVTTTLTQDVTPAPAPPSADDGALG